MRIDNDIEYTLHAEIQQLMYTCKFYMKHIRVYTHTHVYLYLHDCNHTYTNMEMHMYISEHMYRYVLT